MRIVTVSLFAITAILVGAILLAFTGFALAYVVDGLRAVFVDGRLWLLLLVIGGAPIITILYWAAMLMSAPLMAVLDGEFRALPFVPIGLGVGYLLWRASNWVVYGLLNIEPWAYNFLFGWLGLSM